MQNSKITSFGKLDSSHPVEITEEFVTITQDTQFSH